MKETYTTNSQNETEQLGQRFSAFLKSGDVVAFFGDLGAGKTAFTRGIMRGLGYDCDITSPTFAIVNEYKGKKLDVAHFDMYRVSDEDGLYSTGFYDYLDGRFAVFIEWSENIEWALDEDTIKIEIEGCADMPRTITIEGIENKL